MHKLASYSLLLIGLWLFGAAAPGAEGNPAYTQQELDQMLAPIALYPDALLSDILMAATYPLEVVQAARWSSAHTALSGDEAVRAVSEQNWDASVKSLVAFPQVLQTLDSKLDWTERLGDAFIGQQAQVMDTVQQLRQRAQAAGNLNSNAQQNVSDSDHDIAVASSNPEVVYVPYYDPSVVYGLWWWPLYPPVFWSPWGGYGWNGGFAWGLGIGLGADFMVGSWDWHNHRVYGRGPHGSGGGQPWQHDPEHRRGVPYRSPAMNRQFGRTTPSAPTRADFRGHESPVANGAAQFNRRGSGAQMAPDTQRSAAEPRSHAFENVGRGGAAQGYSARGHASMGGHAAGASAGRGASRPSHR